MSLNAVDLESARTIDIDSFAPAESVDWIWFDTPYYLTPDDPVGVEAYCVIRDAMRATGMIGLARLVLQRRERAVMLKARDNGIVLWTLRYGEEVRDASDYFEPGARPKLDPKLMSLVAKLIEERKKPWSPDMVRDPIQARLLQIIEEKKKGVRRTAPTKSEAGAGAQQRHQHHGRVAQERGRGQQAGQATAPSADLTVQAAFPPRPLAPSIGAAAARKPFQGSSASEASLAGALSMVK